MKIVLFAGGRDMVETIVPPPIEEEKKLETHPFVELMIIVFCFIVAVCAMIAGAVGNYVVAGISVTLALFFVIIMLGYRGVIGQRQ
jgi:uncharacterized oligopeptide transporter (OPT) family protein